MFNEIVELENIYRQKVEIFKREAILSAPKLNDLGLIPTIYDWFCEIQSTTQDKSEKNNTVEFRKHFIFIILYLYSPQKLVGGKTVIGLRDVLINVIGLTARTVISNNSCNLMVDYQSFKDFRASVDKAYILIQERFGNMGIRV